MSTCLSVVFVVGFAVSLAQGRIKASRNLHSHLLNRIMRCPMSFFDTTPLGRIVNRFSRDVDTVDVLIPGNIEFWLYCSFTVLSTLIVVRCSFTIQIIHFFTPLEKRIAEKKIYCRIFNNKILSTNYSNIQNNFQ